MYKHTYKIVTGSAIERICLVTRILKKKNLKKVL